MHIVMCVDPAISTKEWADYSALVVMGFAPDGMAYILDARQGRWSETELIDEVYAAYMRTQGIVAIGFEAIGFQKLYFNEFRRAAEVRGIYLPLTALPRDTKIGKNVRIRSLEPSWNDGTLVLAAECPALGDLLNQAERFRPWKESTHDDLLDAAADCLQFRVLPNAPDPYEGLQGVEREDAEIDDEIKSARRPGSPALDRGSLRMQRLMRRQLRQIEHGRENIAASDEFFVG
jgi:predicted phage terminase large subunit-like protein